MFGVVLLVTFIMPVIYPLFIAVVVVSYLCVYLIGWVSTYVYSWINIYRGWTNNENTTQYRNKTVCVSCTERALVLSFVILCMGRIMPVSMQYRLCLETVKELQNGRLHRFSKRIDCWCTFSWSICNKNCHFIRCIQSSRFQDYDDIHKSWEDINS